MNGDGTLSRDYLAAVQQTLATLHLWEQSIRAQAEQAGLRRFGPAGEGEPIQFQPGLTDAECDILAKQHGLLFPPDLRSFLQYLLPIRAQQFPNWREDAAQELTSTWDSLLGGIWGDIDPRQEPYFALNADTGAWEQVTPAFQPRLWLSSGDHSRKRQSRPMPSCMSNSPVRRGCCAFSATASCPPRRVPRAIRCFPSCGRTSSSTATTCPTTSRVSLACRGRAGRRTRHAPFRSGLSWSR